MPTPRLLTPQSITDPKLCTHRPYSRVLRATLFPPRHMRKNTERSSDRPKVTPPAPGKAQADPGLCGRKARAFPP